MAAAEEDVRAQKGWGMHAELHSDMEVAFFSTGAGMIYDLFEQHPFRQMFYGLGIHPETAFGCAPEFWHCPAT